MLPTAHARLIQWDFVATCVMRIYSLYSKYNIIYYYILKETGCKQYEDFPKISKNQLTRDCYTYVVGGYL